MYYFHLTKSLIALKLNEKSEGLYSCNHDPFETLTTVGCVRAQQYGEDVIFF